MTKLNSLLLLLAILLSACSASVTKTPPISSKINIEAKANAYFSLYKKRENFTAFINFYAENVRFKDIVYGVSLEGKHNLAEFFNWHRGEFSVLDQKDILTIDQLVVSGNQVITTGIFHQFIFNGKQLGPWQFIIRQEFNEQGLIIYQEDWINYSPKKILIGE